MLKGQKRAIVNQAGIETASKETLGKRRGRLFGETVLKLETRGEVQIILYYGLFRVLV